MKPAAWLLALALLAPLQSLDATLEARIQTLRRPWLEGPMRDLTEIGKPVWVLSGLLAIALLDTAAGLPTVRGCIAVLVPVNLTVEALKWGVGRPRPDGDTHRRNSSFPSSHAANAMALAWMLSRRWRRAWPAFWALALLISFSRLYLDRHFPIDVIVGWLIGLLFAWGMCRRWPMLDPARVVADARAAPATRGDDSP